jgi:prepilin-type N-terminal cleavage/methylation domain-containing protein
MRKGFSLVELSIVLVILGLLTGGILAGQSLIHAAEMRKTIRFHSDFQAAWNTFRDKYFALPGDMTNAISFWGKSASLCNGQTGTAATTGTCNGDGSGHVDWNAIENVTAPQQLSLAGLGNYSQGNLPNYAITGINGYSESDIASFVGSVHTAGPIYADLYGTAAPNGSLLEGNALQTSRYNPTGAGGTNQPISSAAVPMDLWNIDTKMDDGLPTSGHFQASNGMTYGTTSSYDACLVASGSTYAYNLTNTAVACRYLLLLQ